MLRFEKYFKLPTELRILKDKLLKDSRTNEKLAEQLKNLEVINPWVITDLDQTLGGNPFAKENEWEGKLISNKYLAGICFEK